MEGFSKIFKYEDYTLECEIYENTENLPHNEQSVQCCKNDLDNYGKEDCTKVNDSKNNLLEKLEEPKIQQKSSYRILEDACIKNSDWGDPFKPQHIKIDFTPVPGVDDNEFLQQKCIDFWKIVNKHPKLQSVKIEKAAQSSSNEIITDKIIVDQGCSQEMEIPAINALRRPVIQQKAFPTIQKYTFCGHSQNEYIVGQIQNDAKVEQRQVQLKKRPHFSGLKPRSDFKDKSSITKSRGLDEVKMLCHKMDEWDLSHPRSMETPNLAPSLRDMK